MRIVRRTFLLALTALAAMAFAASTASALEVPGAVEIIDEDTLEHCDPITQEPLAGGCELHFDGEITLVGHIFGIEANASDCNVELEALIDEDGEGTVYFAHFENHAGDTNCTRTPCGLPWEIHGEENDPAGSGETIHAEFCAHPSTGADNRCLVEAPIVDTGDHDYEIPFNDLAGVPHAGGPPCELTGGELHIETGTALNHPLDPHSEIEIIH